MADKSVARLGGVASIAVGGLYLLIAITFLVVPAEQQGGSGTGDLIRFFPSFHVNPTPMMVLFAEFTLCAVLAMAAVPAIARLVRDVNEGLSRWTSNLALLGFAIVAVYYVQMIAESPSRAAAFVAGDSSTRAALAIPSGVDPQFLLRYGATGLWIFVVSVLALKGNKLPKILAAIGILAAAMYWLLAATDVLGMAATLRTVVAIVGGVVAGPIWYIWVGSALLKSAA
jgi:hypothetical protein